MPIADGDVLRVVAKMSAYANDVQNVYHVKCDVTTDPGDASVLASIIGWLDTAYQAIDSYCVNEVTFDSVAVWNLTTNTFIGEDTWSTLTAGTDAGNNLPPQSAPLVLFNTNVNRSQGRKYLPLFSVNSIDGTGTITATPLGGIATFAASILSGISGTGWSGEAGNYNVDIPRFVAWATAVVRDLYATQRRRYVGRGS